MKKTKTDNSKSYNNIEAILGKKVEGRRTYYKVQLAGQPESSATWEPKDQVPYELIHSYEESLKMPEEEEMKSQIQTPKTRARKQDLNLSGLEGMNSSMSKEKARKSKNSANVNR
jgi:hypothetical protein